MKKIFIILTIFLASTSSYAQNIFGGIATRVNDTTTYQAKMVALHDLEYHDFYYNNEATTPHWDFWNGIEYEHICKG